MGWVNFWAHLIRLLTKTLSTYACTLILCWCIDISVLDKTVRSYKIVADIYVPDKTVRNFFDLTLWYLMIGSFEVVWSFSIRLHAHQLAIEQPKRNEIFQNNLKIKSAFGRAVKSIVFKIKNSEVQILCPTKIFVSWSKYENEKPKIG